jgi:Flp pilus assembly protein TadG
VKTAARRIKDERGSAVVLLVASLSFFLCGAMGLAIDGAQVYAQRQMAQSAADAAAQAGIVTIFDGSTPAIGTSAYYCTSSNTTSPCNYVSKNGYTAGACSSPSNAAPGADCIYVNPNPGVAVSYLDSQTPNELQVTITRAVPMTLMKMMGINSLDVTAQATAAIVDVTSPVPIIVTHPSMPAAGSPFSLGASASITICGGPQRSIQVNSSSSSSLSGTGTVDLSGKNCTPTGTGTDFGDFGGPNSPPFTLLKGTTGHYIQPADPILDPLASLAPPNPAGFPLNPMQGSVIPGSNGCPASSASNCVLYFPGEYTLASGGINIGGSTTAIFAPGIYYLNGKGVGFSVGGNASAYMATGLTDATTGTSWSGQMLVYLTGPPATISGCSPAAQTSTINVATTGSVNLAGYNPSSLNGFLYKSILFWVDPSAVGNGTTGVHLLSANGLNLVGTIYTTDTVNQMTCGQFQTLQLTGNGVITGEIIASMLEFTGNAGIQVNPNAMTLVRQIALVNGE